MSIIDNQTLNHLKKSAGNYCIVVGVHLTKKGERSISPIDLLILCINSLTTQFIPVAVYLSVSFETPELETEFRRRIVRSRHLTIISSKKEKTTFRHICDVLGGMNDDAFDRQHEFVMFCEASDTYNQYRTAVHIERTSNVVPPEGKEFAGLVELKRDEYLVQEYWRYCIDIGIVRQFFARIMCSEGSGGELIDFPQCDFLFSVYLRQLSDKYLFARIGNKMVTTHGDIDLDYVFSETPNLKYAQGNMYTYILAGGKEKNINIRNIVSGFENNHDKLKLYKFQQNVERMISFVCDRPIE